MGKNFRAILGVGLVSLASLSANPLVVGEPAWFAKTYSKVTDAGVQRYVMGTEVKVLSTTAVPGRIFIQIGEEKLLMQPDYLTSEKVAAATSPDVQPTPGATPSAVAVNPALTSINNARARELEWQRKVDAAEYKIRLAEMKVKDFDQAKDKYMEKNSKASSLSASLKMAEKEITELKKDLVAWYQDLAELKKSAASAKTASN